MLQPHYVTFEEFNAFKKMTEEKLRDTASRIDVLTEIMISNFDRVYEQSNKKFGEMTDIMMKGFDRLDNKIDVQIGELRAEMNSRFERNDQRLDSMDQRFDAMDQKFELIEHRFELMDQRFYALDEKFDRKFIENSEKIDNLTELMMDGFDMLRDKIEEYK